MRILCIIPARGGSKGLPDKNILQLCGKPLIGWTIEQARKCKLINEIFVTTDSIRIAKIVEDFGIKIPFLRPPELASDTSSSVDVVIHVLDYYRSRNMIFDYIVLLEPTSPLRRKTDLDSAIRLAIDDQSADGIVSLGEIHLEHPMIAKKVDNKRRIIPYIKNVEKISQRQQTDKAYFPYGVLYMIKTEIFLKERSFYTNNVIPYYIERWQNYEIDDIFDLIAIDAIFNKMKEEII